MGMSPPCPLVPNRHQNPEPACPGACHGPPEASHANPSHPGPLPWPQSPVLCRPDPLSSSLHACPHHGHPGRPARARGAPDRQQHAHATPAPPDTAPVPPSPCTSPTTDGRMPPLPSAPWPDPHTILSPLSLSTAIKGTPRPRASTTPPLPLSPTPRSHRRGARELHFAPLGHRAVPPLWATAGDASGALTLPRPAAVDHHPRRSPHRRQVAPRAAPLFPLLCSPSGGGRCLRAVDRQINGRGSFPPVLNFQKIC